MSSFLDWLDDRTNYRTARRHLLEEPLPPGTGWWFVTGSVLLFLLGIQILTGVVLSMYYVPASESAYDSVRFITSQLSFGHIIRGLHFFGASFIVVAAVVHMLRVVVFGSYKKPREVTWITGVLLLLIILGFALSGYLLPWDQRAYWATTVTINIARSTPLVGEQVAGVLRGGPSLGALTLLRWYSAHVFLLPAALILFTVAHIYLMRRHGISGPLQPSAGEAQPFYPSHALKDTIVIAVVFAGLLTGNCEEGARIKLQHFDIWKFFRCGAYGDEVIDRNHLYDVAVQRAEACGAPRVEPHDVVVVGDTVLDVACARAAGARSVAVATGPCDLDTLRKSGADVVVRDLSDTAAFFQMLGVQI